jgi:hypothetical protein
MPPLRVMTYNAQFYSSVFRPDMEDDSEERAARIVNAIQALPPDEQPDVIAFNEVWTNTGREELIKGLKSGWPHAIRSSQSILLDPFQDDFLSATGLLIVSRLPFLLKNNNNDPFMGGHFKASESPDSDVKKGNVVVQVGAPTDTTLISLVQLQNSYSSEDEHRDVRADQLDEVRQRANFLVGSGPDAWRELIVVGDMTIRGDPDAVSDEWNVTFEQPPAGSGVFGDRARDGWNTFMRAPTAAVGADPGFTFRQVGTGQRRRVDYQCFGRSSVPGRALVPQHMFARLRDLGEHWALLAHVQFFTPNSTPDSAFVLETLPALPTGTGPNEEQSELKDIDVQFTHEGSYQWVFVREPGTYSIWTKTEAEVAVFAESNLSGAEAQVDVLAISELPDALKAAFDHERSLSPRGQTFAPDGPFFIRIRANRATVGANFTGTSRIRVLQHRGESPATAFVLHPDADPLDPRLPSGKRLGTRDLCWFRADIPRLFSGEQHTHTFVLKNPQGLNVSRLDLLLDDASTGLGSAGGNATELSLPHTTFGPQKVFLRLERSRDTDTAFTMVWQSGVTFLRLDQPLHFHCNDETGMDWPGDDEIALEFGADSDPLPLFKGNWDDADTGEDWPDFTQQVRNAVIARAGGPVRSISFNSQISIMVEETGDIDAGSPTVSFINKLDASDNSIEERSVTIPVQSGSYSFACTLSKRP